MKAVSRGGLQIRRKEGETVKINCGGFTTTLRVDYIGGKNVALSFSGSREILVLRGRAPAPLESADSRLPKTKGDL